MIRHVPKALIGLSLILYGSDGAAQTLLTSELGTAALGLTTGGLLPDVGKAKAAIEKVESNEPADKSTVGVAAEPTSKAKAALARAQDAQAAGDTEGANLLSRLSQEWAETARDILRASAAEKKASQVAKKAELAETKVERTRALLAEAQVRRAQATAKLSTLEADVANKRENAAEAEDARVAPSKKNKGTK